MFTFGISAIGRPMSGGARAFWWIYLAVGTLAVLGALLYVYRYRKRTPGTVPHPYYPTSLRILRPGDYDVERFKVFQDALAALYIGAGLKRTSIVAVDLELPIAYGWNGYTGLFEVLKLSRLVPRLRRNVVVVTPALLAMDLTAHEIEAIVADVLAKLLISLDPSFLLADVLALAEKYGVSVTLLAELEEDFPGNYVGRLMLIQDSWAARLTNGPAALKSAIQKSFSRLENHTVKYALANPLVFVDPPLLHLPSESSELAPYAGYESNLSQQITRGRLRINELRCINLEIIEHGMRQPHMEVREAQPVTAPQGWE